MKKPYMMAVKTNPIQKPKLVADYLNVVGNNIIGSSLMGKTWGHSTQMEDIECLDINDEQYEEDEEISHFEDENPFAGRVIGQAARNSNEQRTAQKGKCPSCSKGFTSKSKTKQCHNCDKYTHLRKECISKGENPDVYYL